MDYNFSDDLKAIREILGYTQFEMAKQIGVEQVTISRNELRKTKPSSQLMDRVYNFAFDKKIQLNRLKEMLWIEKLPLNHKLLFHGAKGTIKGSINTHVGRINNDFGQGFYTGETYVQAISFVSGFEGSSVYYLDFDNQNLRCKEYFVNQEWMMTIAYYRGALENYKNHQIVQKIIKDSRNCDYIIAPIADNRMFRIIDSFIQGEITDEQCKHCLAATNLGKQYVFVSDLAISQLKIVERVYLADNEKNYYKEMRSSDSKLGEDKVKLARIQYRGKGKYIDEILV
nr:DUF3990 domain-containing protein [uncultured Faecalibacillus sp.]